MMDMLCNKCTLQFDKKYVFDLHLFLVHGEKMAEVKIEPVISEDNFQELQANEPVFPDHVVDIGLKCKTCDASFEGKGNLDRHVSSVHEGKKPFKCNICNASFARKNHLKTHVASVHEGKKPFKCNICDASFSQKPRLSTHVVSVHEGINANKC